MYVYDLLVGVCIWQTGGEGKSQEAVIAAKNMGDSRFQESR